MQDKTLYGTTDTITFEEADANFDKLKTELLYYMYEMAKECTDDEEEQSDICVNMSTKLGQVLWACELRSVLEDPQRFIEKIPYGDNVEIR